MDHIEQNVQDLMQRYSPRVPSHRYSINFVPVISESITDVQSILLYDHRYMFIPAKTNLVHLPILDLLG